MIYLVTNNPSLFGSELYEIISIEKSLRILNSFKMIQYDSETTGRDPYINKLLCIQFGNKEQNIQIIVDTQSVDIQNYKTILESKYLIMQNGKFDLQFLYTNKIVPLLVYDTMIVEQLLYLGYPKKGQFGGISYSLDAIAERYLDTNIDKSIRDSIHLRGLDDLTIEYAANDVVYLEDIMQKQLIECKKKNCLVGAKLECDFVPVIAYLEWCGITLDIDLWKHKMEEDTLKLKEREMLLNNFVVAMNATDYIYVILQGDLFEGFDTCPKCNINWASSSQVIKFVKYLGFNTLTKDKKTGLMKDSVEEKVLKAQKGINDEFLKLYFDYQEVYKIVTTYGQNYIDSINPITGRIHTQFWQLGASSGRMTCGSKQNNIDLAKYKELPSKTCKYVQLQTLPSDELTRKCFIAGKNRLFCSADYSGLEARLGADIYNEQSMINEFLIGTGDIHSLVASFCFEELKGKTTKEIKKNYPHLRKKAKAPGFAKQFGGSAFAIASSLNCSIEEAQNISDAYDKGFSGITNFAKTGLKELKKDGYILISPITGHKLYWWDYNVWRDRQKSFTPEFWDNYRKLKEEDYNHEDVQKVKTHFKAEAKWKRLVLNTPTQGCGIIILKEAMINFYHWIIKNNLFDIVKINNLVHDEANCDYPETLPEVAEKLKYFMEKASAKYCKKLPIPAEISVNSYWVH